MFYYFEEDAGSDKLFLNPQNTAHFKARRQRLNDVINISSLNGYMHEYKVIFFERNKIELELLNTKDFKAIKSNIYVGLAFIDTDSIFEIAPYLNELGLEKLILVYTDYSQKQFKLDDKKMQKLKTILINSSMQCGRADILELEIYKSLDELAKKYNDFILIDFNKENQCEFLENKLYIIGPEGGFSDKERNKYKTQGLKNNNILKAKTATIGIVSKILI